MECPHLKDLLILNSIPTHVRVNPNLHCAGCDTTRAPWFCISCGALNCGRYVLGHAKEHFERNVAHCVCMDCMSLAVFCYLCDEFVINDTKTNLIDKLRDKFRAVIPSPESIALNDDGSNVENADHSSRNDENAKVRRLVRKTAGLRNLGNTCFMNAVLQSLSNISYFCGYIKQLPSLEDRGRRCKSLRLKDDKLNGKATTRTSTLLEDSYLIVEELRKTMLMLARSSSKGSSISPESLFTVIWRVVPRFRGYQQQDAHEFMRYLLDRLHTELLTLLPFQSNADVALVDRTRKESIVTAIFGGILQSEVRCLTCDRESKKLDPFLDLSLDIPSQFVGRVARQGVPAAAASSTQSSAQPVCKISDCLRSFTDLEMLSDTELYVCPNCHKRQPSSKKFWISVLPNVLCLHLKRFRWTSHLRVKLETLVEFPDHDLDMSSYVLRSGHSTRHGNESSSQTFFSLAAVVVHHGSGAGSGHYTAYAQNDGQWFHFNDSSVNPTDISIVLRSKAYILFYVRDAISLPSYFDTAAVVHAISRRLSGGGAHTTNNNSDNAPHNDTRSQQLLPKPGGKRSHSPPPPSSSSSTVRKSSRIDQEETAVA